MLFAVALLAVAFDPPAHEACEAAPWHASSVVDDVRVTDHSLGDFAGHDARARVCREDSGYGYTRVSFVIWVQRDDRSWSTMHLEHGMTACPEVTVHRTGDVAILTTSTCSYFDDAPTAVIRTRLRWHSDPPGLRP